MCAEYCIPKKEKKRKKEQKTLNESATAVDIILFFNCMYEACRICRNIRRSRLGLGRCIIDPQCIKHWLSPSIFHGARVFTSLPGGRCPRSRGVEEDASEEEGEEEGGGGGGGRKLMAAVVAAAAARSFTVGGRRISFWRFCIG